MQTSYSSGIALTSVYLSLTRTCIQQTATPYWSKCHAKRACYLSTLVVPSQLIVALNSRGVYEMNGSGNHVPWLISFPTTFLMISSGSLTLSVYADLTTTFLFSTMSIMHIYQELLYLFPNKTFMEFWHSNYVACVNNPPKKLNKMASRNSKIFTQITLFRWL